MGLATILAVVGVVAVAVVLFQGGLIPTVSVTVLSPRAGLVMNPDAKVKMRGVQVGKVASIESRADGQAALHLAMDPSQLPLIPGNVLVDITSSTVFGAKFVRLVPPAEPSFQSLRAGQVLDSEHVTVEPNTVFQQLTSVLSKIEPVKLNETLGALASGLNGRGENIGRMLSDFDALLAELDSSRPALNHDLTVAPEVLNTYADAAPDLVKTEDNVIPVSQTVVDEQNNLDAVLLSTIGLADTGNEVLGANWEPLTSVLHLMVPTTDLLNEYHEAVTCGIGGAARMANEPPAQKPGINLSIGLDFGTERYRYPDDLPRVAAKGGPQCVDLPDLPFGGHPPFVVADVGSNPFKYGNQRLVWDSDLIKQWLFGPIGGPPRNSAQVGQPG
ncbi:MAG TPA: MCE family protein [Mycobacterium sp.]|nr:MCE family protein [Mycobacterium sp.]